jgi:integrase
MRSTFNLKEPNKDGKTPIRLIAYFKTENKSFKYSTGEVIHPNDWDSDNRHPKHLNGRTQKANEMRSINTQLERYSNFLSELISNYKLSRQDISIEKTRIAFDEKFKRVKPISNKFIEVYDLFLKSKLQDKTDQANSTSTIKRYGYFRTLLIEYQTQSKKKLHFNQINKDFYNSLVDYCITVKKHSTNTLSRNMGLFKTFMNWAVNNHHTYNLEFRNFKNIKKEQTDEIALTLKQFKEVYDYDFSNKPRLERIRDLFVFGCSTGMRYSNYSKVKRADIYAGHINVRDVKNNEKTLSIPLNDFSKAILEKYKYQLPQISNQKFNKAIKEVFRIIGYTDITKKTRRIGNKINEEIKPLYERISSHCARRSFITIMKNKKIPDKVIMSYTGHKSIEVLNKYYRPNDESKVVFMEAVWKIEDDNLKIVKDA